MNQQDYFILWSVYAAAAFVLLLASIFFTSFLWRFIKEPIILVIAILLFSPTLINPEQSQYAPAIAVMAMDFLMQVGDHQIAIANELLYRVEIALAVYFIFAIFIRWPIEHGLRKWQQKRLEKKQQQDNTMVDMVSDEAFERNPNLQASEKL